MNPSIATKIGLFLAVLIAALLATTGVAAHGGTDDQELFINEGFFNTCDDFASIATTPLGLNGNATVMSAISCIAPVVSCPC